MYIPVNQIRMAQSYVGQLKPRVLLPLNLFATKPDLSNNDDDDDDIDSTKLNQNIENMSIDGNNDNEEVDCVEPPIKKLKLGEIEGYGKSKKNKSKKNKNKKKKPTKSKKGQKKICISMPKKKHLKKRVTSTNSIRRMIGKRRTQKLKKDIFTYLR